MNTTQNMNTTQKIKFSLQQNAWLQSLALAGSVDLVVSGHAAKRAWERSIRLPSRIAFKAGSVLGLELTSEGTIDTLLVKVWNEYSRSDATVVLALKENNKAVVLTTFYGLERE